MAKLNMDTMPNEAFAKPAEGVYVFEITRCEIVKSANTQSMMFQFDYTAVENKNIKVNYDNCPYEDKDGNPMSFGLAKLKKIMKATGVNLAGDFEPRILPPLLIGKKLTFKADYNEGKSKYLQLSDINSIVPPIENIEQATPEMFMVDNGPSDSAPEVDITDDNWEI